MGTVYEAVQLDLERTVAIKVLPREAAGNEKANARLRQEAMAAARLGHPNVVEIFELGTSEDGSPFIVMERLVGASLKDVLLEERRLPVGRAVRIALEMLDALGAAHAAGIIHRDVKPGNVMLVENDRVKLVDFGLARFSEDERSVRTTTGTLLGTPAYFAPEQLEAGGIDGRTDLHAVGLCLFEMLLGARPWRGSISEIAVAILRSVPPRVDSRRDDVPPALADVIERALAKDPGQRFASAAEMSAALRASVSTKAAPAAPVPAPPRRSLPIAPIIAIAVVIAIAAVGAIAIFLRARHGRERPTSTAPAPVPAPPSSSATPPSTSESESESSDVQLETDASVVKSEKQVPTGHVEVVLCNDPTKRFGHLCAVPHPHCHCGRSDENPHASWCAVPFVGNDCPAEGPPDLPGDVKPGAPCTLHYWESTEDGGARTWRGRGVASCQYCNMSEWYNEPRRHGVVGAPCTGVSAFGKTVTGRYLRRLD